MATKMMIIMYTGENCGKCKGAKVHLENLPAHIKENLVLKERNVDKNSKYKYELTEFLKSNTLPTFDIYEGTTRVDILRGFDENIGKIMGHLGL
ncbi:MULTISPECIES: glutaredoxin domain-containing protein [Bacillus cereus group]|uniref:glutaredoxin domain-containing protein n=1 Tax=Bacillus cereus group TaxID=86661 RepID=UPI000BF3405E|nr:MULTISPECIES: glutaredoxin domain-containing protein [Bacillus cereus group]PFB24085.1 NrdH-redoxin [Bacillus cereus]QWH09503.1 glutaredoxin family protein [Bacillus mycoides]